jgi:hypothetical protein
MFCRSCGTKLEEGLKFCTNCGTQIGAAGVLVNQEKPVKRNTKTPSARVLAVTGIIVFLGIILTVVLINNRRSYSPYTPYTQNENNTQYQPDYSYPYVNPYGGYSYDFIYPYVNPYGGSSGSSTGGGNNSARIQQLERQIREDYASLEFYMSRPPSISNSGLIQTQRELIATREAELRRLRGY